MRNYLDSFRYRWGTLTRTQQIVIAAIAGLILAYLLLGGDLLNPGRLLAVAAILLVALPVHEFAHAAAAVALGDDTPKWQGRYTLDPRVHLDPLGAALIFFVGFGWAKPVQWTPSNIRMDPRWGSLIVAAAGPLSNLLLALLGAIVFGAGMLDYPVLSGFLSYFILINVSLFVFNLIPVPPLDGSHILFALLPGDNFQLRMIMNRFGMLILLAIIILGRPIISALSWGIVRLLYLIT